MTGETWLPIPGYEGRYDVSDQGRVRSLLPWRGDTYQRQYRAQLAAAVA